MGKKIEDIQAWEEGKDFPTYAQLEKLSYTIYKKPLAIFFFPEPPNNVRQQEKNFRTLNNEIYREIPTQILEIMNKARVMQLNLQELDTIKRIKLTDMNFDIKNINFCEELRDVLNISIELQKKQKTIQMLSKCGEVHFMNVEYMYLKMHLKKISSLDFACMMSIFQLYI